MKPTEITAALTDLIEIGEGEDTDKEIIGSETRTYNFETPISKLLGKEKYQITQKVPVASDLNEAELVAQALGKPLLAMVKRALDIELRAHYVEIEKAERTEVEAKAIKDLGM